MAFAVQCMHCMEWTFFEEDHEKVAASSDTLAQALTNTHLRCRQPSHVCVAPFRAVVYKGRAEDLEKTQIADSWSTRMHALYKNPEEKIPGYVVLQFCNQPVKRYRHIELETLFNKIFMRVALRGLSSHIKGVVSIYAATVYENGEDRICWVPIEPMENDPTAIIPQGFNPYCKVLRESSYAFLQVLFSYQDWRPQGCQWSQVCETKHAAKKPCVSRDWPHCLRLLNARERVCCCYKSDLSAIRKIERHWIQNSNDDIRHYQCDFAEFDEMAVPIIVHNHLVGVIFHGQFVTDKNKRHTLPQKLPFIEKQLTKTRRDLEQSKKESPEDSGRYNTEAYRRLLSELLELQEVSTHRLKHAVAELFPPKGKAAPYRLDDNKSQKEEFLRMCASELSRVSEARYRDMRFRAESLFKKEVLHRIRMVPDLYSLPKAMEKILARMIDFWAFDKGIILSMHRSDKDGRVNYRPKIIAHCPVWTLPPHAPEALNRILTRVRPDLPNIPKVIGLHPNTQPRSQKASQFLTEISEVVPKYKIQETDIIVAVIHCVSFHLCFALFGRNDPKKVSPLRPNQPKTTPLPPNHPRKGGFSKLFENFFLDTCTDAAREYLTQRVRLLNMQAAQGSGQPANPPQEIVEAPQSDTPNVHRRKRQQS